MSGGNTGATAGTIIGGIAAVVGAFFTGGATLGVYLAALGAGAAVGGAIGAAVDGALRPAQQGPRLNDLNVQTSTYGAFISRQYGTIPLLGNIFWLENNKLNESSTTSGGKGGGAKTKNYTYSATFALGLCKGPIIGVKRVWIGGLPVYDVSTNHYYTLVASLEFASYCTLYRGTDDQLPDPRMQATLGSANVPAYRGLAYIVFNDLPLEDYGNSLEIAQIKVEVVTNGHNDGLVLVSDPVPLSAIVSAETLTSQLLSAEDIDVSELTDSVRGYRISSLATIRAGIEPLRTAWPFDVIQHGYQIKFKRRGGASVATIPAALLDARSAGADPGVQIANSREMDSQLPQKVAVKYWDFNRECDIGEQFAERINTDAVNVTTIELAVVLDATQAINIAEILLSIYWQERNNISFSLPPAYNTLEPADIITIISDQATMELRLLSIKYTSDGRLECLAKPHKSAVYTASTIGEEGESTGPALKITGLCIYELLDIPLLDDAYNKPGFTVAMTGELPDWSGGRLYKSTDNGQNWFDVQAFSRPGATMGLALTQLVEHSGTVFDKAYTLSVQLYQGELSSVTESALFAGANWFAYGADGRWEIIAAQNCVVQEDDTYILSDFIRGQFGTEWATGLHAVNDKIVLLDTMGEAFITGKTADIGIPYIYRGITHGKALESDTNKSFTYRGVNLECLSPCALTGSRHPTTDDWTITWTRRSRLDVWRDLVDMPLAETSESYEIDIYDADFTLVLSTLTASLPSVSYPKTQQDADSGVDMTTLNVKIYQMSSVVGRGYPLAGTLTP